MASYGGNTHCTSVRRSRPDRPEPEQALAWQGLIGQVAFNLPVVVLDAHDAMRRDGGDGGRVSSDLVRAGLAEKQLSRHLAQSQRWDGGPS